MGNPSGETSAKAGSVLYLLFWLAVSLSVFAVHADEPDKPQPLEDVEVLSQDGKRMAEWDRGDAVDYAFSQAAKLIEYLFLAAMAVIGFVVKSFIVDLDAKDPPTWKPGHGCKTLVILVLCVFGLSMASGLFAYGYFPHLATRAQFSLYGGAGGFAAGQTILFAAGVWLLLILCGLRLWRLQF